MWTFTDGKAIGFSWSNNISLFFPVIIVIVGVFFCEDTSVKKPSDDRSSVFSAELS